MKSPVQDGSVPKSLRDLHGPFALNMQVLRPGDVILSRGNEKQSKKIAFATWGPFSHAAIVITGLMIFESDGEIVGYKPLRSLGLRDGHPIVALPDYSENTIVLRHPSLENIPLREFEERFLAATHKLYGFQYPEQQRLARLARLPPGFKRLVVAYAKKKDSRNPKVLPGTFCSEAVASIFRDLGLALFEPEIPPEDVTPNALLNSALREVSDAVISMPDERELHMSDDMQTLLSNHFGSGKDPHAEGALVIRLLERHCIRIVDMVDAHLEASITSHEAEMQAELKKQARMVIALNAQAESANDKIVQRWSRALAQENEALRYAFVSSYARRDFAARQPLVKQWIVWTISLTRITGIFCSATQRRKIDAPRREIAVRRREILQQTQIGLRALRDTLVRSASEHFSNFPDLVQNE